MTSSNNIAETDELPDDPNTVDYDDQEKRKKEMIKLLQHAADELGKSPTIREFKALDLEPSVHSIKRAFGTWNDAKREAGLETQQRGTLVDINEDYFKRIDSMEKAYWLGTLFATSSLNPTTTGGNYNLILCRAKKYEYFVREFAEAVNSQYSINIQSKRTRPNQDDTVSMRISNPTFIDNLLSAGYPEPDESHKPFPSLSEEYWPAFVRGYLESAGYFSGVGWYITVDSLSRADTFQSLFERFGAKRPTSSEKDNGKAKVRVSNVFDIRSMFETCWPDLLETDPSWTPYPQKILDYLNDEYPYPESVHYLSE